VSRVMPSEPRAPGAGSRPGWGARSSETGWRPSRPEQRGQLGHRPLRLGGDPIRGLAAQGVIDDEDGQALHPERVGLVVG